MPKVTTVKTEVFSWNEENTAEAVKLYNDMVEELGVIGANERLKSIAEKLGAKSGSAVRSKLVSAKAYVKADQPRKVGSPSAIRKIHYVRALSDAAQKAGIEMDADALDSLETSKMSSLKILAELVGVEVTGE